MFYGKNCFYNCNSSGYSLYGLDAYYNYANPGSDSALAASISAAYEKGEPIVAYYWEPTWLSGKYDLILLQDAPFTKDAYPEGLCEFPSMTIKVCVAKGFTEQAPEYCNFLRNYHTTSALISTALAYMQDNKASYTDTAKWFLKQHDDFITEWLPADSAALVRAALQN
jgi:glycine betaine/proline transport system substrate-binding protein